MNSMSFHAGGVDILAYVTVVPTMFPVTILAAYVPARRASRIPPTRPCGASSAGSRRGGMIGFAGSKRFRDSTTKP
jgi:hypothetical protein